MGNQRISTTAASRCILPGPCNRIVETEPQPRTKNGRAARLRGHQHFCRTARPCGLPLLAAEADYFATAVLETGFTASVLAALEDVVFLAACLCDVAAGLAACLCDFAAGAARGVESAAMAEVPIRAARERTIRDFFIVRVGVSEFCGGPVATCTPTTWMSSPLLTDNERSDERQRERGSD